MFDEQTLDVLEEREDVYRKMKDGFNVLASIMADEAEKTVIRIRAVRTLSESAKTLRRFIVDEERFDALEKEIDAIKKQIGLSKSEKYAKS